RLIQLRENDEIADVTNVETTVQEKNGIVNLNNNNIENNIDDTSIITNN
ncbi:MAG: hypothetical protein HY738_03760, partial [Bacteroidia bacterium]|nr:hypothetical protein [Bacteroidia bacterium]